LSFAAACVVARRPIDLPPGFGASRRSELAIIRWLKTSI
jgi:hypothetical protein